MTKVFQLTVCLVLAVAASNGLPVEDQAPLAVDIPAVAEDVQKAIREPEVLSVDNDSVEILPIATSQDSSDEIDVGSRVHSIFDLFNLNRPQTPLFVFHRRPAIRDPFADIEDDHVEVVRPTQTQNVFVREQQQPTNSFDFMRHMDMMMQRVQHQLNNFMGFAHSHLQPAPAAPRPHNSFPRPIFPSFFDIHRGSAENETESGEVINLDKLPANYSNSTSEIKEIDGQQVQVNKTIKRISNGNGSSFFQVSVINYRPRGTTGKPAVAEAEVEATPAVASSEIVTQQPEIPPTQATEEAMKPEDPKMNEIDQLEGQQQRVSGIDDGLLDAGNNIPARI